MFIEKINQQQITWGTAETNSHSIFLHLFYGTTIWAQKRIENLNASSYAAFSINRFSGQQFVHTAWVSSCAKQREESPGQGCSCHFHFIHIPHTSSTGRKCTKVNEHESGQSSSQALASREGAAATGNSLCKRCSSQKTGAAVAQSRTC